MLQPAQREACLLVLLTACIWTGCQAIHTRAKPTLFAHRLKHDQIVLHSDFPIEKHERLLGELSAQRELLADKLGLPPTDVPIHVYLFSDDTSYYDYLNQRFPGFPHRRAIFVDTDVELSIYAHWGDHLAEDLRHEITHGYLHSVLPHLPLWLDEGLAEYFEVGGTQNGLNAAHLTHLLTMEKFEPNLRRLEQLASAAKMTQLDYAESWAWVHFLLESDVDKTHLLTDYLADLQQGSTSMLSQQLQKRLVRPKLALVEHLNTVR